MARPLKFLALTATLSLGACAVQGTLTSQDGQRYNLVADTLTKTLETDIDGVHYKGRYIGSRVTTGSAGTVQSYGMTPIYTSNSVVSGDNNRQAILTGTDGSYLECYFRTEGLDAVGKCISNKGRQFVLTTD